MSLTLSEATLALSTLLKLRFAKDVSNLDEPVTGALHALAPRKGGFVLLYIYAYHS